MNQFKDLTICQSRVNFAALTQVATRAGLDVGGVLVAALQVKPDDLSLLRALDYAAAKLELDFGQIYKILRPNLAHFNRHIRRNTISALAKLSQSPALFTLAAAERATPDLATYREKLNLFRKWKQPEGQVGADAFYMMMFGNLYVNFILLMPEIKRMLIAELEKSLEVQPAETLDDVMVALSGAIRMAKEDEVQFDNYSDIS